MPSWTPVDPDLSIPARVSCSPVARVPFAGRGWYCPSVAARAASASGLFAKAARRDDDRRSSVRYPLSSWLPLRPECRFSPPPPPKWPSP